MLGIDLDELGQTFNTASMFLELKKSIPTEIQALHIRWVHLEDLIRDANDAKPILQLVLADNKVEEADEFETQELSKWVLVVLTGLIFFLVIVRRVAEVIIAVYLLVNTSGLQKVSCLEELSCNSLEVLDALQLPRHSLLVEVLIFADPNEAHKNGYLVALLEECVLVEYLVGEVGAEFAHLVSLQLTDLALLHGPDYLANNLGKGVLIQRERVESSFLICFEDLPVFIRQALEQKRWVSPVREILEFLCIIDCDLHEHYMEGGNFAQ